MRYTFLKLPSERKENIIRDMDPTQVLHYYPGYANNNSNKFRGNQCENTSTLYVHKQWNEKQYSSSLGEDDDDDVKRPMNSFLLWAKIMRRKYAAENPNLQNAEISKLLGKIWNSMSTTDKRPFVEKAEKLRIIHMKNYPNYRYAPKKRKDRKQSRMISPEVAAALHSTLFDVNNIINQQIKEKQGLTSDLKSYGYLKNMCSKESTVTRKKFPSEGQKEEKKPVGQSRNTIHYNRVDDADDIQITPENVETMTLHYHPVSNIGESLESTTFTISEKHSAENSCKEELLSQHNKIMCNISSEKEKNTTSFISQNNDNRCTTNLTIKDDVDLCHKDNNCFDDYIPDFLQALIDSPLHLSSEGRQEEGASIWNDIADVIDSDSYLF